MLQSVYALFHLDLIILSIHRIHTLEHISMHTYAYPSTKHSIRIPISVVAAKLLQPSVSHHSIKTYIITSTFH